MSQSGLRQEGINALGIKRTDGTYVGVLTADTKIQPGDTLVIYGRIKAIEALDRRKMGLMGDVEHQEAVEEQKTAVEEEKERQKRPNRSQQ